MKKTLFSSFSSFVWLYSLLLLTGCSDTQYTGSMLGPGDVDSYIVRAADGSICLADASDSVCFTLIPEGTDIPNAPIIHVYPQKLIYVFYYDEHPIVRVERFVDTTGIRQALTDRNQRAGSSHTTDPVGDGNINADAGEIDMRQTDDPEMDDPEMDMHQTDDPETDDPETDDPETDDPETDDPETDDPETDDPETDDLFSGNDGWFIRIYYPKGRDLPRGISQLEDSGLNITINGKSISSVDIEGFAQITGPRGTSVQFFYPNVLENTSRLIVKVTGLVSDEETVTFQVDPPTENRLVHIAD